MASHLCDGGPLDAGETSAPNAMAPTCPQRPRRKLLAPASIAAALLVTIPEATLAQAAATLSPAEICLTVNRNPSLGARLPRTAARLKAGGPLRIVAVGSSSTVGMGVWNSAETYPEVMRRELARLRPHARVLTVTSGRIGETIPGAMSRFGPDVLAYRPDLVVWQLGTNDILWGNRAVGLKDQIVRGVRMLKAGGADVILMDVQYTPRVLGSSQHPDIQAMIAVAAQEERAGLFSRFNLMHRSVAAGVPLGALSAGDGLHMSAAGYECVGRALARAIHAAAR